MDCSNILDYTPSLLQGMYQLPVFGIGLYLIWSISSLGLLFDNSIYGWINELLRSVACLVVYHTFGGWKGFIVPKVLINVLYGVSVTISSLCIATYLRQSERKNDVSSEVRGIQKKEAKKIK